MKRHFCGLAVASTLVLFDIAAVAQPANHMGADFASLMERKGCVLPEAEAARLFQAEGFHISDYQAQVMALYRSGYVVSGGEGILKLTKWGQCP